MPRTPVAPRFRCSHASALQRLLSAGAVAVALGCSTETPMEPSFKPVPTPLTVSPTSLQFAIPHAIPGTLTVTTQGQTDVSAAVTGSCATVAPPTTTTSKGMGGSPSTATFTVTATAIGNCSVRLADKKGREATVPVTVVATAVNPKPETVAAGLYHSCALDAAGAAYCWGVNDQGRLGDGTTDSRTSPVPVSGSTVFASLAAGASHTCGLDGDGHAWCWGNNAFGQLGDGTVTERHAPVAVAAPSGGTQLTFSVLTAGWTHTCGLGTNGVAWCWGASTSGQLGSATISFANRPTRVAGVLLFRALSAEALHTCGLTSDGSAWCWGLNGEGEVGDGTTNLANFPTAVAGGFRFTTIGAGGIDGPSSHTCAANATGSTRCWGDNSAGQLGDGTTTDRLTPALAGGPSLERVSGGNRFTCGLTPAGAAYCWGINTRGELGIGTTTAAGIGVGTPTAVVGPGGGTALTFTSLSAGADHACARAGDGNVYCWGENVFGQLGYPGQGFQSTPTRVTLTTSPLALTGLTLSSTTVVLESTTGYQATVQNNTGSDVLDASLDGYIRQGTALYAAGGTTAGILASGANTINWVISASNSSAGSGGPLVPGPATFVLNLRTGATTVVDTKEVAITLAAAP